MNILKTIGSFFVGLFRPTTPAERQALEVEEEARRSGEIGWMD